MPAIDVLALVVRSFVFSLSSHSGNGLSGYALDYIIFGNGFMEQRQSRTGQLLRLETSPAKYTRRGLEDGVFWFVENYVEPHDFAADSVFHLQEPDINQELYGLPEYLSALNSVWLNESATLYRRKYFENGAHAGYVMYVTDPAQNKEDISALRDMMSKSKGDGNFRTFFITHRTANPTRLKLSRSAKWQPKMISLISRTRHATTCSARTTRGESASLHQHRAKNREPHHSALRRRNKTLQTPFAHNAIPATPARFMCRF